MTMAAPTIDNQIFGQLIDAIPQLVFWKNSNLIYSGCNQSFAELVGLDSPATIFGMTDGDLPQALEKIELSRAWECQVIASKSPNYGLTEIVGKGQTGKQWFQRMIAPLYHADGSVAGVLGIYEDVTEILSSTQLVAKEEYLEQQNQDLTDTVAQKNQALEDSKQLLQLVIDTIPQSIFWKDAELAYLGCNQNFARIAGFQDPEDIIGKYDEEIAWAPEQRDWLQRGDRQVIDHHQSQLSIVHSQHEANGQPIWMESHKVPLHDAAGSIIGMLGTVQDITDRKQAELTLQQINSELERRVAERTAQQEALTRKLANRTVELEMLNRQLEEINGQLDHLAHIDGLTQVANRRRFNQALNHEWKRLIREQQCLSLMLLDIDHFKGFNDHYGHPAGDDCLHRVAQCLKAVMRRPADLVARYGGEEFAILLPNTDAAGAMHVAQLLQAQIQSLQILHATSLVSGQVTVSIGVVSWVPEQRLSVEAFVEQADQALYEAKNTGRARSVLASSSGDSIEP